MKVFEVAIIGSGPAGASAAIKLAEKGIATVIIEKETLPRYKTCGGGFAYRGRREMPFSVEEAVETEFFRVDAFFKKAGIHVFSERKQPIISMVMRDDFDNFLVNKAKEKGITLLENHKLQNITFDNDITLHTSKGDIKTKFVIAADGALSTTAKLAGWKETRLLIPALEYEVKVSSEDFERLSKSVRLDFDAIPMGYGWSFPKKNHLSIGLASFRKVKVDFKQLYREYLTETLGIKNVLSEQMHGFQIPVSPRTNGFVKKNIFLVGDAAGFADPLTAEGISNAIFSGIMAAESIIEGNLDEKESAKIYNNKLETSLIPELKTGLKLSKLFYENEKIRNFLIKKYGDRICEGMTQILMGERTYPKDVTKHIKRKLRNIIFS
ncbi:geranylgeranyl reductase family protein [Polaribacter sp. WD7]|uniref:geranylgeranyl reductase family protein n=1 Tax=Polaribacter sp. WD7 TaxID=2269061 RepID=UPI000DF19F16|nr:geranylgeranyl reductase family protein [Polaribacter sp. WD7]RCS28265.1 geranylgeranyl reductase family protein [Polaribacter sp. WD7]